jgi:hypothetical protein
MRTVALLIVCLFTPMIGLAQSNQVDPNDQGKFVPLKDVVQGVQEVLIAAQAELANTKSLPISTAEFDFQAGTTSDATVGVSAIVSADVEHETDGSQEIDYTYQIPSATIVKTALATKEKQAANRLFAVKRPFTSKLAAPYDEQVVDVYTGVLYILDWFRNINKPTKPEDLKKSLLATIVAAGKSMSDIQVLTSANGQKLPLTTYVVTISFTVTNTISGGVDAGSLIVVSPTAKYTGSVKNVQTVKLTFGK